MESQQKLKSCAAFSLYASAKQIKQRRYKLSKVTDQNINKEVK